MNTQLSTTDTRTADRTSEQLAAIADRAQTERDAQTLARELFEARREVARLTRELSRTRAALADEIAWTEMLRERVFTLEIACQ